MKLEEVILRSTRALQPVASSVPVGTLYYVTDESIIERSDGSTWQSYSPLSASEVNISSVLGFASTLVSSGEDGLDSYIPGPQGIQGNTGAAGGGGGSAAQIPTQWFSWRAGSGVSTTILGIGVGSPTIVSLGGSVVTDHKTSGTYIKVSGDGLNGRGAVEGTADTSVQVQMEPTISFELITGPDLTSCIAWIQLSDQSNGTSAGSDTASGNIIAFRYSAALGANWHGVTRNGVSQSSTVIGAIAVDTKYILKIRVSGTTAYFSINGGTEVSIATNLPAGTVNLRVFVNIGGTVADSNDKTLSVGAMDCSYGVA